MIRSASSLLALVLIGAGCTSSSEYGIEPSPLVRELDGHDNGSALEQQITEENIRAQEGREEPIFNYDDNGGPE